MNRERTGAAWRNLSCTPLSRRAATSLIQEGCLYRCTSSCVCVSHLCSCWQRLIFLIPTKKITMMHYTAGKFWIRVWSDSSKAFACQQPVNRSIPPSHSALCPLTAALLTQPTAACVRVIALPSLWHKMRCTNHVVHKSEKVFHIYTEMAIILRVVHKVLALCSTVTKLCYQTLNWFVGN